MGTSTTARLLLGTCGLGALGCLAAEQLKIVYVERTPAAVRTGHLLVLVACLALLTIAGVAASTSPGWPMVAVAVPAIVCGGVDLLADDSLLPQLAAVALLVGLAGLVGIVGIVARG